MVELLTPDDVAARYKISPATVRRWCKNRQLKATKVGKQWRIDPRDLEAFFKAQEAGAEDDPKADGLAARIARPSFVAALG